MAQHTIHSNFYAVQAEFIVSFIASNQFDNISDLLAADEESSLDRCISDHAADLSEKLSPPLPPKLPSLTPVSPSPPSEIVPYMPFNCTRRQTLCISFVTAATSGRASSYHLRNVEQGIIQGLRSVLCCLGI